MAFFRAANIVTPARSGAIKPKMKGAFIMHHYRSVAVNPYSGGVFVGGHIAAGTIGDPKPLIGRLTAKHLITTLVGIVSMFVIAAPILYFATARQEAARAYEHEQFLYAIANNLPFPARDFGPPSQAPMWILFTIIALGIAAAVIVTKSRARQAENQWRDMAAQARAAR